MSVDPNKVYIMECTGEEGRDHLDGEFTIKFAGDGGSWRITQEEYRRLGKPKRITVDTRGNSIKVKRLED